MQGEKQVEYLSVWNKGESIENVIANIAIIDINQTIWSKVNKKKFDIC